MWIIYICMCSYVHKIILEGYIRNQREKLETGMMMTSNSITRMKLIKLWAASLKKECEFMTIKLVLALEGALGRGSEA